MLWQLINVSRYLLFCYLALAVAKRQHCSSLFVVLVTIEPWGL